MTDLTREQVAEVVHEALLGKRSTPMQYTQRIEDAVDAVMALLAPEPRTVPFRVGRSLGRTVYNEDDILIGVMDTPELGAMVVDALNRAQAEAPQPRVLWQGFTRATDAGPTCSYISPPVFADCPPDTAVRVIEDTETPEEDDG